LFLFLFKGRENFGCTETPRAPVVKVLFSHKTNSRFGTACRRKQKVHTYTCYEIITGWRWNSTKIHFYI